MAKKVSGPEIGSLLFDINERINHADGTYSIIYYEDNIIKQIDGLDFIKGRGINYQYN
jgi:hypothetical protein